MAKFTTPNGTEVETEDPSTINDYRHRQGWEEVDDDNQTRRRGRPRKSESGDDDNT